MGPLGTPWGFRRCLGASGGPLRTKYPPGRAPSGRKIFPVFNPPLLPPPPLATKITPLGADRSTCMAGPLPPTRPIGPGLLENILLISFFSIGRKMAKEGRKYPPCHSSGVHDYVAGPDLKNPLKGLCVERIHYGMEVKEPFSVNLSKKRP